MSPSKVRRAFRCNYSGGDITNEINANDLTR